MLLKFNRPAPAAGAGAGGREARAGAMGPALPPRRVAQVAVPAARPLRPGRIFAAFLLVSMPTPAPGRILAIDYGHKRVGLAITDPLQLIASPLDTIHSQDLVAFVLAYHQREPLAAVVVGMPRTLLNEPTDSTSAVVGLLRRLRRELPAVPIHEIDERFTSRLAKQAMLAGGLGRKARQDKATVDKVSAALILQSFLASPSHL